MCIRDRNYAGLQTTGCSDGQQYISAANINLTNPLEEIMLYPNPIQNGILHIENLLFPVALEVYDLNGKLVHSQALTHDEQVTLSVQAGVYLVKLTGNGYELIKQFVSY